MFRLRSLHLLWLRRRAMVLVLARRSVRPMIAAASGIDPKTMLELFPPGRTDAFLWGNLTKWKPLNDAIIHAHLKGDGRVGFFPLDREGCVRWAVVDLDNLSRAAVLDLVATARRWGLTLAVEKSKSKGHHLWVLFAEPSPAVKARALLLGLISAAGWGAHTIEVFPKQSRADENGTGNGVFAPWHGGSMKESVPRTVFINPAGEQWPPYPDQVGYVRSLPRLTEAELDRILTDHGLHIEPDRTAPVGAGPGGAAKGATALELPACAARAYAEGVDSPGRSDWAHFLARHFRRRGLPEEATTGLLIEWNKKNRPDPLPAAKIPEMVRSAYKRAYTSLGCELLPHAREWCGASCPVARATGDGPPPAEAPAPAGPLRVPDEGMVGLGRDFAELYSRYVEVPPAFFYFAFLTYFGALIARKVTLDSALLPQPRLYTILLGESADTRKSTGLSMTASFFGSLGPEWTPRVLYGVGSAEGIAAELAEAPDLLLQFDEFKSFVGKARLEGSIALPMVSTLFERGEYDNRTKAGKVSIRGGCLSLLAACTSETYAGMFDAQFHAIGFLNRLWLVSDRTTQTFAVPARVPEPEIADVRSRVIAALRRIDRAWTANGGQPVAYPLTSGGRRRFETWYRAREGSVFERRLDTYGHRLLPLLAALLDRDVIDEDLVGRVVALLQYQLEVRRDVDPVDAESRIAALEEKIRRALARGARSKRDLQRMTNYQREGIWAWTTAVENLRRENELGFDPKKGLFWLRVSSPLSSPPKEGVTPTPVSRNEKKGGGAPLDSSGTGLGDRRNGLTNHDLRGDFEGDDNPDDTSAGLSDEVPF